MKIKKTYRDENGFEYKSKRSKNSEVKKYYSKVVEVKKSPVVDTGSHITFKNQNYSVVYNKSTNVLTVSKIVSKALNKYGKEVTIPVLSEVVEGVTIESIASYV